MKTIALAGALCLLFASSTLCKANSSPWCAADVAILNFKNYKGQDLADRTSLPQGSLRPKPGQKSVWGKLGTVDAH
jgi:hypothetical protein